MKRNLASEIAEGFDALADQRAGIFRVRGQRVILGFLPYAFTEHGALMAAAVLNSPREE